MHNLPTLLYECKLSRFNILKDTTYTVRFYWNGICMGYVVFNCIVYNTIK